MKNNEIRLEVPNEVRIACLRAIANYLDSKNLGLDALDSLIGSNTITDEGMLLVKQRLLLTTKLSDERKMDVDNLLDIIHACNVTTGSLYSSILLYFDKMRTGWWIFQTAKSELKNQFYQVMIEHDAIILDSKIIQLIQKKPTADITPTDSASLRYTSENLCKYEAASEAIPVPIIAKRTAAESGKELVSVYGATPSPTITSFIRLNDELDGNDRAAECRR